MTSCWHIPSSWRPTGSSKSCCSSILPTHTFLCIITLIECAHSAVLCMCVCAWLHNGVGSDFQIYPHVWRRSCPGTICLLRVTATPCLLTVLIYLILCLVSHSIICRGKHSLISCGCRFVVFFFFFLSIAAGQRCLASCFATPSPVWQCVFQTLWSRGRKGMVPPKLEMPLYQ